MRINPLHAAFVPFMFAHWLGWKLSLAYGMCLAIVLLVFKAKSGVSYFAFLIAPFCGVFITINLHNLVSAPYAELAYAHAHQYLGLFIVTFLFLFSPPWNVVEIRSIARTMFAIAFLSIALEFIAVNFISIEKGLMPAVRYSPAYFGDYEGWHRPFGLTGQPSANGGILLFCFMLIYELGLARLREIAGLVVGALMTISGQAILSVILVLGLLHLSAIRGHLSRTLIGAASAVIIYLILAANVSQKISLDYLVYVLWDKIHFSDTLSCLDAWEILFGTLGQVDGCTEQSSEVSFVESIRLFGVVFTVAIWVFVWLLLKNSRHKCALFIGCVLASAHYPTIFYIEAQLPLALLYLSTARNRPQAAFHLSSAR